LEDIAAPDCFIIEQTLKERMNIPVFHDDQHGTAIIAAAGLINACELTGKSLKDIKVVCNGAGAAAIACTELIKGMGVPHNNVIMCDRTGVIYQGRTEGMDQWKSAHAAKTTARSLAEAIVGADVFLGLSAANALSADMVKSMADQPIIFAMANPDPEISPPVARAARPDAIIATGRSDFPNQVNNVLCFPYIFRGALDVGATTINEAMKIAATQAIAELAREAPSDIAAMAYGGEVATFGEESLIPSPFDPRLILRIAPAVALAAMETGVATRPITDWDAYHEQLDRFVFRSGFVMKPIFSQAKQDPKRVIYADGEDERVLRAALIALEEGIAFPILIGRPAVIEARCNRYGLKLPIGQGVTIVNPEDDPRYRDYVATFLERAGRRGITPAAARTLVRTNTTVIAAIAVVRGDADAMITGLEGRFTSKLKLIRDIIGAAPGMRRFAGMSLMITQKGHYFIADTHVRPDPTADEIADTTIQCAQMVARFGITPKVALLSHSDFGASDTPSSIKMREATAMIRERMPELEVDGEMQGDTALSQMLRDNKYPDSRLKGEANLLIMPNLDAANIAYQLIKILADALPVGPILIGPDHPAHVLTTSVTARGVVNMTAVAVVEAQAREQRIRKRASR
jgi:malate dehydrogenase (oxaloacetate-decarboxylating)(NADP+)